MGSGEYEYHRGFGMCVVGVPRFVLFCPDPVSWLHFLWRGHFVRGCAGYSFYGACILYVGVFLLCGYICMRVSWVYFLRRSHVFVRGYAAQTGVLPGPDDAREGRSAPVERLVRRGPR